MDTRSMPVPEGLAGMRVDAGLARLLGLSRTAAAALAEDGGVDLDGTPVGKSDRLTPGAWLEVRLPEAPAPLENTPVDIEGMTILYSDDDIVAVDKPAGVAAHATVGWHGPTVLGGLAAAGFRITTSGIHERQGIVHRLDVGTSGVMVVALSERAYTLLKRAFKQRTVDKRYHALVQGHPDPSSGTIDAPIGRHRGHDWKFAVTQGGRHSITHYDTLEAHQAASLLDVRAGNRPHTPDPGALRRVAPPVRRRPDLRRRPDAREKAWAGTAMAACAVAGLRASRRRPTHRDHQPLSGRPAARAGRAAQPRALRSRSDVTPTAAALRAAVRCGAYVWWGLCPGFFPLLLPASAPEVLAHRFVWSAVFLRGAPGGRAPAR